MRYFSAGSEKIRIFLLGFAPSAEAKSLKKDYKPLEAFSTLGPPNEPAGSS